MNKKMRGIEHKKVLMIANNYNYSVRRIRDLKRLTNISKSQTDILDLYENYVEHVRWAINQFSGLEQSILSREYFSPLPKGWWMDVYPRSTFYRLRLDTTRRFLDILNA